MEHHHVVGPDSSQHDMDVPDLDTGFEPQFRARSNTWPLRPREIGKSEEDSRSTPTGSEAGDPAPVDATVGKEGSGLGLKTKSSSRRNAWGNLSYADLITKAIESSPEKRLTLSQIYDWMVQNVPYFKDKGDTNSSAGWKNSIRHNLSLHSRFMRIQNEGTGKSSWWVLNPDAKPGKSPRRRATSMDTKTYEKKRSRVKKKLDQLRALGVDHSPKGSELGDNDLSHSGELFSLSPQDFRGRTNSNASSLGGRLSPIQSMYEPDLQDGQVPPMSPVPWNQTTSYSHSDGFTETLSESLAEMIVGDTLSPGSSVELGASSLSTPSPLQQQTSPSGFLPAPPPPYPDGRHASPQQLSPNPNNIMDTGSACIDAGINGGHTLAPVNNIGGTGGAGINNRDIFLDDQYMAQELANLLQDSPPQSEQNQYAKPYQTADTNTTLMTASTDNSMLRQALTEKQQLVRSRLQAVLQNQHHRQRLQDRLKQLQHQQLQRQMQQRLQLQLQQQQQQQHQQQQQLLQQQQAPQYQSLAQSGMSQTSSGSLQQHLLAGGVVQQTTQRSPVPAAGDNGLDYMLPLDLDLVTIAENNSEDLDCDVDEIISHELSLDGLLDFNFEANTASTNTSASGGTLQT